MKIIIALTFVAFVFATLTFGQETQEQKNSVYGEFGCGTMYHGFDVGGDFFPSPTCKTWINYDRKVSPKTTVSFGTWLQRAATKPMPNGADEADLYMSVTHSLSTKASFTAYIGNYTVHHLNIQKFSGAISRNFLIHKMPVTFTDELMFYSTSKPKQVKGGFLNKADLSTSRSLTKTTTVNAGISVGIDGGPFGLGGPALMGFLHGRLEQKLSKHFSAFVNLRYSQPLAGRTTRGHIFSGDGGIAYHFDF